MLESVVWRQVNKCTTCVALLLVFASHGLQSTMVSIWSLDPGSHVASSVALSFRWAFVLIA